MEVLEFIEMAFASLEEDYRKIGEYLHPSQVTVIHAGLRSKPDPESRNSNPAVAVVILAHPEGIAARPYEPNAFYMQMTELGMDAPMCMCSLEEAIISAGGCHLVRG